MENENIVETIKIVTLSNLMKDCPNILEEFDANDHPFTWGDCDKSLLSLNYFIEYCLSLEEYCETILGEKYREEYSNILAPRLKYIQENFSGIIYVDLEN